jgi:PhnB protein
MARSARKTASKASAKKKAASKPTRKAASTTRGAAKAKAAKKAPKKAAKKAAKKAKRAQAVPAMYGSITPHLVVSPAPAAIEFYGRAFGAKPGMLMAGPGGLIMHAEIKIGDSIVMLADEQPPMGPGPQTRKTPKNLGGTSFGVMLYVKNVDAAYAKAVEAGATGVMPPADMFWGDRFSQVEDPFGHVWSIATHLKDMTAREMQAAMAAAPPPAPPSPTPTA